MTFKEKFKAERARLGAGKTFTWSGKSYSTDMASDKKETKPKAKPVATSPRPKAKPMQSSPTPKRSPRNTPPKVDSTPPKTLTSPKTTPPITRASGKPKVDSTPPKTLTSPKATPPITTKTGNSTTPTKKSNTIGDKIRSVLTKGYLPGSAADERAKKRAQRYKDMDQAQVDMRMQRAEDEEKRTAKKGKK